MFAIGFGEVSWLKASQGGKIRTWVNYGQVAKWPSGQLNFCRMSIVIRFSATISKQCFLAASKHLGHFRQANRWSQLSPSGTAPAARSGHTSVWSDVADGMYVFGGWGDGGGLSVNGSSVRNAPQHSMASAEANVSMTSTFSTARRREGGICWRCFWKNSSGGLMRSHVGMGLYAVHVVTWSKFSCWQQNVGTLLFVASVVVLRSGLSFPIHPRIWDSAVRFDLSS